MANRVENQLMDLPRQAGLHNGGRCQTRISVRSSTKAGDPAAALHSMPLLWCSVPLVDAASVQRCSPSCWSDEERSVSDTSSAWAFRASSTLHSVRSFTFYLCSILQIEVNSNDSFHNHREHRAAMAEAPAATKAPESDVTEVAAPAPTASDAPPAAEPAAAPKVSEHCTTDRPTRKLEPVPQRCPS